VRYSIATVSLGGDLREDRLPAIAAAGFNGVELCVQDVDGSGHSPAQVGTDARSLGLDVTLYQPLRDVDGAAPGAFAGALARAERLLDAAAAAGAPMLLACSSTRPETVADDFLAAGNLYAVAELAAQRGLQLAYEALSWGAHVRTWRHALRIVQLAGHPSLGLCVDSFHTLALEDTLTGLPQDQPCFAQLADAPWPGGDLLHWSRHARCWPGDGDLEVAEFTGRLLQTGYAGPLSLEVFSDRIRAEDPRSAALTAFRSLQNLERSGGCGSEGRDSPVVQ
jgi:4-hydroxyphenylpyruvate dioxygenase